MTLHLIHPEIGQQNIRHIAIARRVLAPAEDRHGYALPALEPAPGGHPGHTAVSHAAKILRVVRLAGAHGSADGPALAGPPAMKDRTYTITDADLENLDRAMHDLSDLIAPLRTKDAEAFRTGCMLVARLDRVIRRAMAREQRPDGDAA